MSFINFKSPRFIFLLAGTFSSMVLAAEDTGATTTATESSASLFSNGLFLVMLSIVILLLFGILAMAEMVKAGAAGRRIKKNHEKKSGAGPGKAALTVFLVLACHALFAQTKDVTEAVVSPEAEFDYWGLGAITFFTMLSVILLEIFIFYMLFRSGISLLKFDELEENKSVKKKEGIMESDMMKSLMDAVPVEEEESIIMDHEYDGIRELDNNLPPWWKYGFYLTIVIAVVYIFNYHVFHTGKLSGEEYAEELKIADQQIAEYRKSSANLLDETNVTRLTDAASLDEGKKIFGQNCFPCHGEHAEGKEGLGPNLTDDYWLHKGGTKNIFRSIKYGWTDKGMKSWEQDLKPLEIQEVVSYIQSLRGSHPANAKAPQGDLYTEDGAPAADSLKKNDSVPAADTLKNK
jgi:cytochrome c oxidase cbb3-type subunit 3